MTENIHSDESNITCSFLSLFSPEFYSQNITQSESHRFAVLTSCRFFQHLKHSQLDATVSVDTNIPYE